MTEDPTLTALDERARTAAAGVRSAVAERAVPAFDPDLVRIDVDGRPARSDRSPGERRSRPIVAGLAAAAAIAIVVAAVVGLTGTGDPDSTPPADRVTPGDLGRYVLGTPPDGHVLAGVFDADEPGVDVEGESAAFGPLAVYGPDPASPRIGVVAETQPGGADLGLDDGSTERAAVPGRDAWYSDEPGRGSIVVVVDDVAVRVVGQPEDEAELLAAAGAVQVDGDRVEIPAADLPAGWRHLGDGHASDLWPGLPGLFGLDDAPLGWAAVYGSRGEGHVVVEVSAATSALQPLRLSALEASTVEVRGHEGLLTRTAQGEDMSDVWALTWEERPGEVVQISADTGLTGDELVALADDLEAVTADDVPGLRSEVFDAQLADRDGEVVGRGSFSGGVEWALVEEGDLLHVTTSATGGSSSGAGTSGSVGGGGGSVGGEPSLFAGYTIAEEGDLVYAYGALAAEVDAVEVRERDGEVHAPATVVEGSGVRAWVAQLPADALDRGAVLTALAADGTPLEVLEIGG